MDIITAYQIPIGCILTGSWVVLSSYQFKFASFYFKYTGIKAELLTLVTAHEGGPPSFSSPKNNQRSDLLRAPDEKYYHAGQDHEVDIQVEEGQVCYTYISGNVDCDEEQVVLVTMTIILMMMVTDRLHDCWRCGWQYTGCPKKKWCIAVSPC